MPSALSLQSELIWIASPVLQLLCVFLLFKRKLLPQFKFLASFFVFITIKAGVLFLCYHYSSPQ